LPADNLNYTGHDGNGQDVHQGRVGVGSFDDAGNWMDVKVRGVRVERK